MAEHCSRVRFTISDQDIEENNESTPRYHLLGKHNNSESDLQHPKSDQAVSDWVTSYANGLPSSHHNRSVCSPKSLRILRSNPMPSPRSLRDVPSAIAEHDHASEETDSFTSSYSSQHDQTRTRSHVSESSDPGPIPPAASSLQDDGDASHQPLVKTRAISDAPDLKIEQQSSKLDPTDGSQGVRRSHTPPSLAGLRRGSYPAVPSNARSTAHHPNYNSVKEFVAKSGGTLEINRILIATNGIAAVKAMRSLHHWAYETFRNEKALRFIAMATEEDLRANAEYIKMADHYVKVRVASVSISRHS